MYLFLGQGNRMFCGPEQDHLWGGRHGLILTLMLLLLMLILLTLLFTIGWLHLDPPRWPPTISGFPTSSPSASSSPASPGYYHCPLKMFLLPVVFFPLQLFSCSASSALPCFYHSSSGDFECFVPSGSVFSVFALLECFGLADFLHTKKTPKSVQHDGLNVLLF